MIYRFLQKRPLNTAPSKSFPLGDILSITSGFQFHSDDPMAIHRLIGFIMETEASRTSTTLYHDMAKDCLEEQLPFLRAIDLSLLRQAFKAGDGAVDAYANVWLEMMVMKYGDHHMVQPLSVWMSRRKDKTVHDDQWMATALQ